MTELGINVEVSCTYDSEFEIFDKKTVPAAIFKIDIDGKIFDNIIEWVDRDWSLSVDSHIVCHGLLDAPAAYLKGVAPKREYPCGFFTSLLTDMISVAWDNFLTDKRGNVKDAAGNQHNWDVVVNLMNEELREELHNSKDWESDQQFFDEYCEAHDVKFNETFPPESY